ncbi:MAG: hypothetical protein E6J59_17720 [Deltaproteobacteria bacterium]|nr:MAG: hypothetical protein E6J59_17720 [Deltaproteobacteria bacterium]
MAKIGRVFTVLALTVLAFAGCGNVQTPAGYVGYVTQGAILGRSRFYALQTGPTSSGLGWLLHVVNVSVTPYTYSEEFAGDSAVLSRDNLRVSFRVHLLWKVDAERVKDLVEHYTTIELGKRPEEVVRVAYDNFLREPLRTYARDEVQKLNGLEIKDRITEVGDLIAKRMGTLSKDTPFAVISVVVGNIQYPQEVANAVAEKMAATQVLERKQTEIEIEQREAQKRVVQAEGVAKAMAIINERLSAQYLQHEAIEAQKAMVGSPNHTAIYLPVGPMGVPLVGTLENGK